MDGAGDILHKPFQQDAHDVGLGLKAQSCARLLLTEQSREQRQGQWVTMGEVQYLLMTLSGNISDRQVGLAFFGAQVAQGHDAGQGSPVTIGTPGWGRWVASGNDDQALT